MQCTDAVGLPGIGGHHLEGQCRNHAIHLHGRASAAEQRWVTTTSEELAFCCCCSRSIPPGIPASCLLVLPGRPDSRWSAGQNTRAPVAWRKSSDRAVIARFFHRPITPIPGRRLNHRAASPEKIGGTSVSLPRSVPAGRPISERTCSRRCVQFISATAANAGGESGDEYHGADHHRPLRRRGRTSDQQHHAEKPTSARRNGVAMRGEDSRSPANGIRNRHHLYPAQPHRFDNADIQAVSFSCPSVQYLVDRAWMVRRLTGVGMRRRAPVLDRALSVFSCRAAKPMTPGFDIQGAHHHSDPPAGDRWPDLR